jgi:hypothetical protein
LCGRGPNGELLTEGSDQDGLDGVEAVLGLVENDPHVRVDEVGAGDGFGGIVGDSDPGIP